MSEAQETEIPADDKAASKPIQDSGSTKQDRKEHHVKFNPDVQVASLVFQTDEAPEEFGVPVHERLHKVAAAAVAEKAAAKKSAEEAQRKQLDQECPFRPLIERNSESKKVNWELFLQEQSEFVKRVVKKKTDIKTDMVRDETTVPKNKELPRKTHNKIVSYLVAQNKYHGSVTSWERNVENFSKRREPEPETPKEKPTRIAKQSSFQKLYEEAAVREAAQRVFIQTQRDKESRELYRPSTNESLLDQSVSVSSNRSVELDLLRKGEEYRRKREKMLREKELLVEQFSFKPATNAKSREIILRKSEEHDHRDESQVEHVLITEDLSGVKGVQLNKQRPTFDVDVFTSKVQRRQALRQNRVAQLRREQKIQEVADCTFRPSISKYSDSLQRHRTFIDPFASADRQSYNSPFLKDAALRKSPESMLGQQQHDELHLQNLEEELRGVIAEWRYISGEV
jgi:hypothetical protein